MFLARILLHSHLLVKHRRQLLGILSGGTILDLHLGDGPSVGVARLNYRCSYYALIGEEVLGELTLADELEVLPVTRSQLACRAR